MAAEVATLTDQLTEQTATLTDQLTEQRGVMDATVANLTDRNDTLAESLKVANSKGHELAEEVEGLLREKSVLQEVRREGEGGGPLPPLDTAHTRTRVRTHAHTLTLARTLALALTPHPSPLTLHLSPVTPDPPRTWITLNQQ